MLFLTLKKNVCLLVNKWRAIFTLNLYTFRFMSESLNMITKNIAENKTRFREILKTFSYLDSIDLVTRKGVGISL